MASGHSPTSSYIDINPNNTDANARFEVEKGVNTATTTPLLTVLNNGKVGVGTSEPAATFEVAGSAFITNRQVPTTGAGLEVFYSSGISSLLSYDRTNSIYRPFTFDGADLEFNIGGSEKMRLAANGFLGLGTATPQSKLHVVGPAGVTSFTGNTALGFTVDGAAGATDYSGIDFRNTPQAIPKARLGAIFTNAGSYLSLGTSNNYGSGITNTALTIDPLGKVGIGTPAPANLLTLEGDGFSQGINHTTTSSFSGVGLYESGILQACLTALGSTSGAIGGPNAVQLWNFKNSPTVFGTNNTERMRIDGSGYVGIGTAGTPTAKLVVAQTAVPEIARFENSASSISYISIASQYNPVGARFGNWGNYPAIMDSIGRRVFVNDTNNNLVDLFTNDTLRLRVDGAGNVGIGTATPAHKLEIAGMAGNFAQDAVHISTGTTPNVTGFKMVGGSSGNSDIVRIANTDGTVYAGWVNLYRDGTSKVQINASSGWPTYFNSGGYVGIGTATPSTLLDVAGASHFGLGTNNIANTTNGLSVQDSPGSPVAIGVGHSTIHSAGLLWEGDGSGGHATLYTIANASPLTLQASTVNIITGANGPVITADNAGNVGIGTTIPSAKLEVSGAAVITGDLSTHSTSDPSDPALTLGSTNSPSSGSLRFLTSQGNWFGLANIAGAFSIFREPPGSTGGSGREALLTFTNTNDTAVFKGSLSALGFDARNSVVKNVASPLNATDAANKGYVDANSPFLWASGAVLLKNITDKVALGTHAAPHAPLEVANANPDGEIARFTPWSDSIPANGQRSYVSLYNQNPSYRWELSSGDENSGGTQNGFSLRSNPYANGISTDRFYINPSTSNLSLPSIFRFYNQNPDVAWEMQLDGSNGMLLHASARGSNGAFSPTLYPGLFLDQGGNAALGTTNPGGYKLAVKGSIHANEIVVETGWADYVFADDYKLQPLSEVEARIKAEKHLPGVPSAQEVAEKGVSLGSMQATLLAKVEELTLHMIEQEKRIKRLESENEQLRAR